MNLLSAILPTKGRGEQAVKCVNRFFETTQLLDVELFIIAHPDETNLSAMPNLPKGKQIHLEYIDCKPLEAYNIAAAKAKGTHLFDFDDDAWFADGWLAEVYKTFDVAPGNAYVKIPSDATTYWAERAIGNRQFYIDVLGGVISIPHYYSQWNDVEKSDRALMANCFRVADKAYIEHRHWVYGKAAMDETYQEGGGKYANIDMATYQRRKALNFPNDYEGVIK